VAAAIIGRFVLIVTGFVDYKHKFFQPLRVQHDKNKPKILASEEIIVLLKIRNTRFKTFSVSGILTAFFLNAQNRF
jgi:hypothetical protein